MRWLVLIGVIINFSVAAQCKTYKIGVKGDTLNCTDNNNLKQGKWIVHVESLRGEPGYEQEGAYKDDKKDGTWRSYTLMGDIMSIENYKWGYKNGNCSYYNIYGIERKESWKAIDPKYPYDTIDVPDLHNDNIYKRVVKVDASTVRHGTWNYYNPETGAITKTEEYILDQLVDPNKKKSAMANITDSTAVARIDSTKKAKPREVLEYEKKNSNKKKVKVRDGATGVP
ncbi:MAG: hypothetical protein ABI921_03105 [Panacibacter sp.]